MRLQRFITRFLALSLAILTLVATAPVSAAEFASPANIGSVSAVGSVQLRGVGISEGTLFSGDRLNVAPGAYAKVVLGVGPKVEVGENSNVTVSKDNDAVNIHSKDNDAVNIQMTSGNIAFSNNGQKPVRVRIGSYEVTAVGQSRGSVAFVGSGAFDVRMLEGTVNVRNSTTKQSFTVAKGNERLISLGDSNQTGALLASTSPSAIPALPAMPARRQLSGGAKTALIVASVLGTTAAIVILMTKNDDTDADAAARLRAVTGAQTLNSIKATQAAAVAADTDVAAASTNAFNAINAAATSATFTAAEKAALLTRATNLTNAANASKSQLATLQAQLAALENQLANSTPSNIAAIETAIANLLTATNTEVANVNSLILQLNGLVADARAEVPNIVPIPTIQLVPPAQPASPFNP
jgi:hypothetical protein